jgi:lipopolysaccharide biosynthesis protein
VADEIQANHGNGNRTMKILAINLPQFHTFPENDEWWGKGFTEWTNVRKARPLYEGHRQPLVPLHHNYYDLTDPKAIVGQHQLAARYGIDGFVYYHYWFNGKLLLQKPLETLLDLPEADREFCLCWANEPWTRAWDGKNKEIIMPQTFGGEPDWKAHIEYLLPFFRDPRYLRVDGRPVFFVYSPNKIPQFDEMIRYWDDAIEREGMEHVYLIEYLSSFNPTPSSELSSAVMEFEPLYSAHYQISKAKQAKRLLAKKTGNTDFLDYDYLWQRLLTKDRAYGDKAIVRSCFTNFDNSPRKGKAAFITKGASAEKFGKYFGELLRTHRANESELVTINAWNEWGEGAILEPTEQDGYAWLEAVEQAKEQVADSSLPLQEQ